MTIDWDIAPMPGAAAMPPETAALKAAVMRLPEERFAVLDGALYDDLAAELSVHGLTARPLFLEAGGPQAVASGPFLTMLREPADIDRLLAVNGARRSPAFWSWPGGEASLYRHLRTLNLAEIPNENRLSDDDPAYETVIFRHWDAVVLGQMLPLLRPGQIGRFLGAGQGLCFEASDAGGLTSRMRPGALPPADAGMLRFGPEQIAGLQQNQHRTMAAKVAAYLRENLPAGLHMADPAILAFAQRMVAQSAAMGMEAEGAHCRWAYLQLISNERILDAQGVAELFRQPDAAVSPDQRVAMLMSAVVERMRQR